MKLLVFIALTLAFFAVPSLLFASDNQFVTIVNPVRISPYTKNSAESIKAQYHVISSNNLPATWLLRYDVLKNDADISVIQTMDDRQELGIFMEVTKELAEDAGVVYPDNASWHHANAVFLSGYSQSDRVKMIDVVFEKFYQKFGYYPKSIGSWWTDAYSLSYMKETYGITANLTCSDQFATDGYQIWGQYWMYPYYPSKNHAGIPGYDAESQIDIVTIQWAPREPLRGYTSSLYSTQDYQTYPLAFSTSYFEQLIKTYGYKNTNSYGQITVGLEGDFNPADYQGEYKRQMAKVKSLIDSSDLTPVSMSQFSTWFRNHTKTTPVSFVDSGAFDEQKVMYWVSTQTYRIGLTYDKQTKETSILDIRTYPSDFKEPYYISPNKEHELSIYIPSYIDSVNNKDSHWNLLLGALEDIQREGETITFIYKDGRIRATPNEITFVQNGIQVPSSLLVQTEESIKTTNTFQIVPQKKWMIPEEGYVFRGISEAGKNELLRKRTKALILLYTVLFGGIFYLLISNAHKKKTKLIAGITLVIVLLVPPYLWYKSNSESYYVGQSEIDALSVLSRLPSGNVLVYDKTCAGCNWATPIKYAVYENKRSYVSKFSKKPIVQNQKVFDAKTQTDAKTEFQKLNIQYIYLVKYEEYQEKIPFSPGDLHIEKIYDNANAEIWKVIR